MKVSRVSIFFVVFGVLNIANAQLCPPNETWSACATPCPATCSQILPPICTLQCIPACVCNLGFVRDEFSGFCVSVLECLAGPPLLFKK